MRENMKKSDNSVYRDFVYSTVSIRNPLSVTLTSRQWVDGRPLDRISLERDVTHFLNRLNYRLFRKKYSRYGKRLGVFTVIEGDKNTRLHVHLQLECLPHLPVWFMDELIRECWGMTIFGYSPHNPRGVKVKKVDDQDGWFRYQLKDRTKGGDLPSSIDWINTTSSMSE